MIYQISECAIQNEGWKKVTVKEAIENGKTFTDVSVNKLAKDNVTVAWPNWDTIAVGGTIEADYWKSPKGSQYLFAPKPASTGTTARSGGASGVKAAQERKGEMIEKAQDNKERAIKAASAMRAATDLAIAEWSAQPFPTHEEMEASIKFWRDTYLKIWDETEKKLDIPF